LFNHEIYSNFQELNRRIKETHHIESKQLPDKIKHMAEYYATKRLSILNNSTKVDSRNGMPIPYLAYWLSDICGLRDKDTITNLGLSLTYISLVVSVRDDLFDSKIWSEQAHVCLANLYYDKYYSILKKTIDTSSSFWSLLSDCSNEWGKNESWNFLYKYDNRVNPLSEPFLIESSRYLVSITLPTLAAICFITNNEVYIPKIKKFLQNYWMGWKIMDDLRDWKKDLHILNYNNSSVLLYALRKFDYLGFKINEKSMLSIFMNSEFVEDIYKSLKKFYLVASQEILDLEPSYLKKFIDTQLSFHEDEKFEILDMKIELSKAISKLTYGK